MKLSFLFPTSACASLILLASLANAQDTPTPAQNEQDYTYSDENVEDVIITPLQEQRKVGEVPSMFRDDSNLDNSHLDQELGVNVFTAPSISKIFDQLEGLPSIPDEYVLRKRPEVLPTEVGSLGLAMGFLLADGFIAVRSGRMNDIKPIALDLSRYGDALGVGERMNAHSASLLEQAEKGLLEQFKKTLAATQQDVNAELRALRDPDQAHLIALGGWVRALTAATAALDKEFDAQKAAAIFYPDAPAYFCEVLDCTNPQTAKSLKAEEMKAVLQELTQLMTLPANTEPSKEQCQEILQCSKKLSTLCIGQGYEF